MIKKVVKQSDIDPLLGRTGRCMCRCLSGKHNHAEGAVNRDVYRQKEPVPAAISVRIQHGPIDIGIAATSNEFWEESLLSISSKPIAGTKTRDFITSASFLSSTP
jgi:hypothetical protein